MKTNNGITYTNPPDIWKKSCANSEPKLHQLSPYIGKIKSTIADDLIDQYSAVGDLIVDPFSGSGTIPLSATLKNRRVFASDISEYSAILTQGKLFPPPTLQSAQYKLIQLHDRVNNVQDSNLASVPDWIRSFYHDDTLVDILKWIYVLKEPGNEFYFSCLLGILHHQRPGFLSYPSSHLVPYLRDKKYPKELYPELYEFRGVYPRLLKKIQRVYATQIPSNKYNKKFICAKIEDVKLPSKVNCLITSPPYMNALDYFRDNRLRLWFINNDMKLKDIKEPTDRKVDFLSCLNALFTKANKHIVKNGHCIVVVGDIGSKIVGNMNMDEAIHSIADEYAPKLKLRESIMDKVPDVRRSRRNCRGVKSEYILIYQKV